ncbi:MAG TPA: CRISPR-associated endonuclease Cas6 [Flavilitoribacter sp.]|nr:CRISPR-associated endonuclease Cas6 [Flavilitoribacter sp.]HMQ89045.1 CRISPR-associated endonuclease Cas6 [Flavilitoribacter sp.]
MPKVRYLSIRFSQSLFPYEVSQFRAAVIEKTRRESDLFHNHTDEGTLYRYPLIQYKVVHRKAGMICLNEGADAIHRLFQEQDLSVRVGSREFQLEVEDLDLGYRQVQTWQNSFLYSLLNWLPLNQEQHRRWQSLEGDDRAQGELLEKILIGHILAFASGVDWQAEHRIEARIERIREMKLLTYKGGKKLAVSLNFRTNVSLPDFVGLGKGASVGFGIVKRIFEREEKPSE